MFVCVFHICIMFDVFWVQCLACSLCLRFVKSTLNMDVFELLDFYIDEFHIVKYGNLFVNNLESFMLSREVLQVEGVVDEEQ